jgi:hypothetical protein
VEGTRCKSLVGQKADFVSSLWSVMHLGVFNANVKSHLLGTGPPLPTPNLNMNTS